MIASRHFAAVVAALVALTPSIGWTEDEVTAPTVTPPPEPVTTPASAPAPSEAPSSGLKLRRRTVTPPPSPAEIALQQQAAAEGEQRQADATKRHNMFKLHQALGLTSNALVLTQVVLGTQLYRYKTGDIVMPADQADALQTAHFGVAIGATATWLGAGVIALTAPEPELEEERSEEGEFNRITLHKIFAVGHTAGMLATPVLGYLTSYYSKQPGQDNADRAEQLRTVHLATGYATALFLTSAMLTIVF